MGLIPSLPRSSQGPWTPAFAVGHPWPGTYHRTCRGSSGLGSTPPPEQCPCHTVLGDSGSSHTLRGRRGRGHISCRYLEQKSLEIQPWLRRGYLPGLPWVSPQCPQPSSRMRVPGRSLGSWSLSIDCFWKT